MRCVLTCAAIVGLAACGRAEQVDAEAQPARIELEDTAPPVGAAPSPDTSEAAWSVAQNGQAIDFGNDGEPPWLTLSCDLRSDTPLFAIIRHAAALPEQSALFPFIGNGMRSRFFADAVLNEGEWRWEARLAADDPQLEVFEGRRDFYATLPGHGTIEMAGSRIPGEFLAWCRSGGENAPVEAPDPETGPDEA